MVFTDNVCWCITRFRNE